MFVQNFIKLIEAVYELTCAQEKNSDENNGVVARPDSNYTVDA